METRAWLLEKCSLTEGWPSVKDVTISWQPRRELAIVVSFPGQGRKEKSMGLKEHMENCQHVPQLFQLAIHAT